MGDTSWVKIDSWHILSGTDGMSTTLCGQQTDGWPEVRDELPLEEKSCETCLRLHEHAQEKALEG